MDMEGHETSDAKVHCPKKAFLSRARSSSTSISGSSCASLKDLTGLDILASSSELLASKRHKDDSLTFISLPDDVKASFSKRSRDDSLSYASLPDEMKISFSELEETGLKLEDLNFAIPESIEDAAPSNVTLDLSPRPELSTDDVEPNVPPFSNTISSTSSSNEYETPNNQMHDAQTNNSFVNSSQSVCDSSGMNSSSTYGPMPYSEMEIRNSTVSSNNITCTSQLSGSSSDSNKTKTTDYSRSQSAGTDIGSLLKESSNAITGVAGYQGWETVTELPWEEISQVSTTVGSSTEDAPKKKRRMSGVSKNKKMDNIMCQVCGDLAAGFYCGAYICEACKKFYMRAYKQEKLKYVCLRDKQCLITKESRVQCQYCRYQKCLSLNMYCPKQVGEGESPKDTQKMSDIPCRVCSAPSSGFHFGAITCEGCKGFFRRMAKERELQRYQCTKDGNCEINMMTRNLCKACRYKMCLKVGMSVEASRIGRQPNSVKHEISLELKHGVKVEPGSRARHKSDHDLVKIKEEPQEFHQECSMSKTQKSLSWEGWGTNSFQPVLEHSVSIPGFSANSVPEEGPSTEKSGPIWDILLEKVAPQSTSQGTGDFHDKGSQKAASLEVPLTQIVPNKVPSSTVTSKNTHVMPGNYDSKKSLQGEVTLQKDISKKSLPGENTVQKCISEGHARHNLEVIPEADHNQVDSDTSSTSDEEQTAQHKEMMTLINEVIEAARVLEIVNYRVFDTDFIHNGKFMVEDVKVNFKNRYMDPRFQAEHRLQLEKMEDFSSHETAWTSMMNSFTQHAYTTIRFAKNVPGFKTLSVQDQSRLLQASVYPIVLLLLSKVFDPVTKTYNYFNYTKEEEALTMKLFPMLRVLLQHFQHVGEIVTSLKVTNVEYALLSAILLCPSEVKGLKEPEKVECLQNKLSSALQYYEENTYADGAVRYGSLLVRIAELVQCMLQHNLAIGLLLTAHPELKVPQLFDELIAECIKEK